MQKDLTKKGKDTPRTALTGRVVGRHKALLSHPQVNSWWSARSLRSRLSADQALRQLGYLCEKLGTDPAKLLTECKRHTDRFRDSLILLAAQLKAEGRLDAYISNLFDGLASYIRYHRVPFDGFPELSPITGASLGKERVPTPEELGRVLDKLSVRGRVIALLMAHSGVRPGVLGSYQAEMGLTLGDLPDLRFDSFPTFVQTPFVIRIPARLSKTRVMYTTFGSSQLASAVLAYLEERRKTGERLGPETPVVASRPTRGVALRSQTGARFSRGFLTTKNVIEEVRMALQSTVPTGVKWRPYVLRSYCSTRLLMAEGAGKITRDLREAFLGHSGGVAARYNVGKTWGEDLLKEARAAYLRCEPYLATVATADQQNVPQDVAKAMLQLAGFTEEEIEKMDLNDLAAVRDQVRDRLGASSGPRQEVVSVGEVPQRLAAGWQFVAALGTTQAILTSPSSPRASPTPAASALPPRAGASPVPPAGPAAGGGSRGGGPPTSSGDGGPSLPPSLVPKVAGRPGQVPLVGPHRDGPGEGSPKEDSPEPR